MIIKCATCDDKYESEYFWTCPACWGKDMEEIKKSPSLELKESTPTPEAIREQRRFAAALEYGSAIVAGITSSSEASLYDTLQDHIACKGEISKVALFLADALIAALDEKGEK